MDKKSQDRLYKLLGDNVKKHRSRLRLTQEQLATKIELTRTSVVNIEQGKQQTPLHLVLALTEIFNVSLEALIPKGSDYQPVEQTSQETLKEIKDADRPKFDKFYENFLNDQQ